MSTQEKVRVVRRQDYQPPAFWVEHVDLEFDLAPENTIVRTRLELRRNPARPAAPLHLDGENLELRSIELDGEPLPPERYQQDERGLEIAALPDRCCLETVVRTQPAANTSLYGLYQSSGNYCTQCEALGFRKITYFPDRPDVMAKYRVTLRADKATCPVLLSNGNCLAVRDLEDGRHQAVWEDPFPKPSYLFALVAGDLRCHRGEFVTRSGRRVALEIWVEPQNLDRCEHALRSLQTAMRWDEETFGLEYDLDVYMIVAVNDFNMGAMENKGLNIFNSKFVLASPETATDDDYSRIEAVIAHEYFHNWTGNRVTCRDWFQLTLKEGLTVYRDQQFTADQSSAAVKRIDDVAQLRARQFVEDSGPMAHPIRPESYISMDNFYTTTVYEKGAEVVRMYATRLGTAGFRRGLDLYFERHDGGAVTCEDFRQAMADANQADLDRFERWYAQAGTPIVDVAGQWSPETKTFTLHCRQSYSPLPGEVDEANTRLPVPIPLAVGLLDPQGRDMPFQVSECPSSEPATTQVVVLEEAEGQFTCTGLTSEPTPSVLRQFSAPVRLRMDRSPQQLAFQMAVDSDPFNRWDAGQRLATQILLQLTSDAQQAASLDCPAEFLQSFGQLLQDPSIDDAFKSLALQLPSESVLGQEMQTIDPDALHTAREFLKRTLAESHQETLASQYEAARERPEGLDQVAIHRRRLKNTLLSFLASLRTQASIDRIVDQAKGSTNMTDTQAALRLLAHFDCPESETAIGEFYDRWKHDPLVLDKWFTLQALALRPDTVEQVQRLTQHRDFLLTNPNRVRALLGAFTQNQPHFHRGDGAGYQILADHVIAIDANNPQLAARLVSTFNGWRRFDIDRQQAMRSQLERIIGQPKLSKDTYEIVEKAMQA